MSYSPGSGAKYPEISAYKERDPNMESLYRSSILSPRLPFLSFFAVAGATTTHSKQLAPQKYMQLAILPIYQLRSKGIGIVGKGTLVYL